nr:MAG TPA: hypothetical protein [Caudoviricetes sp.]
MRAGNTLRTALGAGNTGRFFAYASIFLLPFSKIKYKICLSIVLCNKERGCCYGKPC